MRAEACCDIALSRQRLCLPPGGIRVRLGLVPCGRGGLMCPPGGNGCHFPHFQRIRTACQQCVQVAAPYEARGHGTLRCHIGRCMVWDEERKAGHAVYWCRGGPLGRPAGKASVFRPFPANSYCLPAVHPGGHTLLTSGRTPGFPLLQGSDVSKKPGRQKPSRHVDAEFFRKRPAPSLRWLPS